MRNRVTVAAGAPPAIGTTTRAPHPATVAQPKSALGGITSHPPHPATIAQPKAAFGATVQRATSSKVETRPGEFSHVLMAQALGVEVSAKMLDALLEDQRAVLDLVKPKTLEVKATSFNDMDGLACMRAARLSRDIVRMSIFHAFLGDWPDGFFTRNASLLTFVDELLPVRALKGPSMLIRLRPVGHTSPVLAPRLIGQIVATAAKAGAVEIIFVGKQPKESALRCTIPQLPFIHDFTVDGLMAKAALALNTKINRHNRPGGIIIAEHLLLVRLCQRFKVVLQVGAKSGFLDVLPFPILLDRDEGVHTLSVDSTNTNGRLIELVRCGLLNLVQVKATRTTISGQAIVLEAISEEDLARIEHHLQIAVRSEQGEMKEMKLVATQQTADEAIRVVHQAPPTHVTVPVSRLPPPPFRPFAGPGGLGHGRPLKPGLPASHLPRRGGGRGHGRPIT